MNNRRLEWKHLRGLYELYENGRTSLQILDNGFIRSLVRDLRLIGSKTGSLSITIAYPEYKPYYERHFKEQFIIYSNFLTKNQILPDARQSFDEFDLQTFLFIADNKETIRTELTTIRHFSSVFFKEKGSKYLEMRSSVTRIVYRLLEIDHFPDQDPKNNQWRFVIDHPTPEMVVFCENLAHLKQPWIAREHKLELWYVGGNNTNIVQQIGEDKLKLPIYYCCDWDLAGLQIYGRLKQILSGKGCELHLLEPFDKKTMLDINSPYHDSEWRRDLLYSGLDVNLFTDRQLTIIVELMDKNKWIEEESQDLIKLLQYNITGK